MTSAGIVIVGAGLAGLRTAEGLRDGGWTGPITLVGDEREEPYDRPPLSKQVLTGAWGPERASLRPSEDLTGRLGLTLQLGVPANRVDVAACAVHLADGRVLPFEGLVIATGTSARRLPGTADAPHVHVVRTLSDAIRLRDRLRTEDLRTEDTRTEDLRAEDRRAPKRVAVVGAGFIGAEVAAAARGHGCSVTVVEAAAVPLERQLGAEQGHAVAQVHARHGVELRCGVGVSAVDSHGLQLTDGSRVEADEIVVGIGVSPNVAWLAGSGIAAEAGGPSDGVLADETLRVAPRVVAVGDIVRWPHPAYAEVEPGGVRIEHWTNAAESAAHAAATLLADLAGEPGRARPFAPVPYFWSDQYPLPGGSKIQLLGRTTGFDEVRVVGGSVGDGRWLALYRRGDHLVAALGVTMMRQLAGFRALLEAGCSWDDALARDT